MRRSRPHEFASQRKLLCGEAAHLFAQAALVPRGLVAVNDAFIDHAVDDRRGMSERRGGIFLFTRFDRQGGFTDGGTQVRGQSIIAGAMRGRLSGSFFSRFRIRQGGDSSRDVGPDGGPQKSRTFSGPGVRLSMRGPVPATCV